MRKYFHMDVAILKANKAKRDAGKPELQLPPLRVWIKDDQSLNRWFHEVVLEGPAIFSIDAGRESPVDEANRSSPTVGLYTDGVVVIDGVRIECLA